MGWKRRLQRLMKKHGIRALQTGVEAAVSRHDNRQSSSFTDEGVEVRYDLIIVDLKQDRQAEGQARSKRGRPRAECEYIRGAF